MDTVEGSLPKCGEGGMIPTMPLALVPFDYLNYASAKLIDWCPGVVTATRC